MLRHVAAFELRHQLRQPLLWASAGVFAMLAFVATATDALQVGGAIGSLNRNAPFVVARLLGGLSVFGAFIVVAFVATSALRDFERGTAELVFSRPVRPRDLLLGRFLGSLAAACLCFASAALATLLGGLMPWLDPERVGPFRITGQIYGLAVLAFPTFVILGAALFALATRVRHVMAVYVVLVVFLVAYFTAGALFGDLETRPAAAVLDPFGLVAFELATRYWTVAEKNAQLPAIKGALLWGRVLWLGLGCTLLAWAVGRFRYDQAAAVRKRRRATATAPAPTPAEAIEPMAEPEKRIRKPAPFGPGTTRAQLASQFRVEARAVLGSLPFLLILAFGLINVLSNMGQLDRMLGTPVWPVTYLMLVAVRAGYSFLLVVILTFYAGETVWRERNLRLDGILDASPGPTWVPLLAKLLALWAAAAVFIGAGLLGLMAFQLAHGYTRIQPLLYAQGFVVEVVPFLLTAVLALFLQVVVDHKLGGYLAMVLYLASGGALSALHFNHHLYRYATGPSAPYSDMNRWGHFAAPVFWFDLYWALAAGVLLFFSYAGWVRGHEPRWRRRWVEARARLRGRVRVALVAVVAAFVATGAFIFYNTNVRNEYVTAEEALRRQADYEKRYGQYRRLPQPRIVAVRADVDIFPSERRAEVRGSYRLVNRTSAPIPRLHVEVPPNFEIRSLDLPPHRTVLDDRRLGYAIYELDTPLAPGQEIALGFALRIAHPGFVNDDADNSIVANGSFLHSRQFPSLGYDDSRELTDPSQRRQHGLPAARRMPKIDDLEARQRNDLAPDADWMSFETTVSTAADQVAVAPGTLVRDWTEGGRRYFHYRMDTPIPKFFAILSARYTVRRDAWNDVGIEVYHHPDHAYNVGRMVDAVKKTLGYMTENFSPYQHRVVRIVEVPRYVRRAASFPNTIPFSESIGFIARLDDPDAIDYPFYVTAHEVAHQWWGYQVLGADVQGASMLSESMAQYSALMVMEKEYGAQTMRRFLRYELDRYLSGRGGQVVEELPLELVEDQPYVYYSKASLVLYGLRDQIGEAPLNAALRRFLESVRFAGPPYPVSRDLIAAVSAAVPGDKAHLLDDLFRSITLFDNQAVEAVARPAAGGPGKYEVTLRARARKLRASGQGVETEVPLDDWIDVGVFGDRPAGGGAEPVLYLEKRHVTAPDVSVQVLVDGRPARAGIDPYDKLIDRTPSDNTRAVVRR